MSFWRHLTRGVRVLANRSAADKDVDDEVEHYLEQATAAFIASGLSPDAARRAARLEVGNATVVREQVRAYGWESVVGTLFADLRYGARRLRRNPGFAVVSILTLALGIGASTAIFSAVNPILFEALPYPQARQLAMIWDVGTGGTPADVTFHTYREIVERSQSFEAVAVMRPWQPTLTGPDEPERLEGHRVTAAYFRALGVPPALGRGFGASDDQLNGPKVVMLSDRLWRRRFGSDSTIVGTQIMLDVTSYTVIGVMPPAFENVLAPRADVWSPLQYNTGNITSLQTREWGHHLRMVGRLGPGVRIDQARRELDTIAHAPVQEFPRPRWASLAKGFIVKSLQDEVTRGVQPALLAVFGAVLLVLAIASVNVTNLLLARGAQQRGEFAMRAALGAGRLRLIRQLLTESLLLAALGGAVGILVAGFGVRALVALSPPGLPRVGAIAVDVPALAFALGITTLIGLVVGLMPAIHASRCDLQAALQPGSRQTSGGHQLTRRLLVVAEVALALMLLVSAGLLLRSLQRLFAIDPGFDAAHLLTMQVQASGRRFDTDGTHRFFAQALEAVRQVPGVSSAGLASQLPLSGDFDKYGVQFESSPVDNVQGDTGAFRYAVSPGYVETMGIPLGSGRLLDARDTAGAPVAVLVSESLARRRFAGQDPIGQRLHLGSTNEPWYTIVGVVGDVKQASLAVTQPDAVYITTPQWYSVDSALWLVVRAQGDPAALAPAVRNAIWSVDKDQPIVRVARMEELLEGTAAERRFALIVFEAFGLVALLLAGTGIYGVLSGSVAERTREIGVRSALGASRGSILALVLRQGMTLTGLGVMIGICGAAAASHSLVTLLFAVSPLDFLTYLGMSALLLGVSGIACWIPAWRAARIDTAITLRAQ